jgi:hypothetical protein
VEAESKNPVIAINTVKKLEKFVQRAVQVIRAVPSGNGRSIAKWASTRISLLSTIPKLAPAFRIATLTAANRLRNTINLRATQQNLA